MNFINCLGVVENFEQLKEEIESLVSSKLDSHNQITLQNLDGETDDWYCGVGSAVHLKNKNEQSYKFIQPSLKGTKIESIINEYGGFRTRIMNLKPRTCYSLHQDYSYRIHIPITTNTQCWMTWPFGNKCYYLEAGNIYWTNTKLLHSAFNGSEVNRIHVVMCVSRLW